MRRLLSLVALMFSLLPVTTLAQTQKTATLHNGWKVTPAGTAQKVEQMPIGCALSPDGSLLAFACAGYGPHALALIETETGHLRQLLTVPKAWNGVAWSKDGKTIYLSGGGSPQIHTFYKQPNDSFRQGTPFLFADLSEKENKQKGTAYLSGLAVSQDGTTLFAGNLTTDTIYALSLPDGAVKTKYKLTENAHPYCLRLSLDGKSLYVTQGGVNSIAVLNTADLTYIKTIDTDKHPNDIAFTPDGRLFVSCANSDCVDVIDPTTSLLRERISMTLTPHAPAGTIPNALALAPDNKTLFVANADNNDVAVVDISVPQQSRVQGFVPTGWYPTSVAVSPDGKRLFTGTGKGMGTGPNSPKLFPAELSRKEGGYVYAPTLFTGFISTLPVPDAAGLAAYTKQTFENTPYRDEIVAKPAAAPKPGSSPIPSRLGDASPIKHILYIIRENRTYDQILGDLKKNGKPYGNGDPDLTLFGENATPNMHELCRQYTLLDNIYCSGDVSGNGHPWSTGAYGTDIGERAWMQAYSGRVEWPLTDRDLFPPAGRIWDVCEKMGLPWVSYYYTWTTTNTHRNMPVVWEKAQSADKLRDFEYADLFIADLKKYEQTNSLPSFMIMDLREDHTEGTSPGKFTPQACVASNDLGLGKIVEACSRSKYWKEMAIFVIEDDAQDGPDHVEAHRTEAIAISPYTRTGKIDSTHYNTVSLLRTMELILGLPPMSQYDSAATPLYNAFMPKPDLTPYKVIPARTDVNTKNMATAYGAKESMQMDFSDVDLLTAVQVDQLNRILWHSIKGVDVPYPALTRRGLFSAKGQPVAPAKTLKKDDDD